MRASLAVVVAKAGVVHLASIIHPAGELNPIRIRSAFTRKVSFVIKYPLPCMGRLTSCNLVPPGIVELVELRSELSTIGEAIVWPPLGGVVNVASLSIWLVAVARTVLSVRVICRGAGLGHVNARDGKGLMVVSAFFERRT